MTVTELKKKSGYSFEHSMAEVNKDEVYVDEWGCAQIWVGNIGVEYNFCIDSGNNYSGIYKMEYNEESGYAETDYSDGIHHEIDFSKPNWEAELEDAMCKAMIELFDL